ncbi:MAG: hypothetical protein KDD52_00390 [Bdellovibrionales bacterium]|nr:hypothetical protein [Bdellovibrionales bacterium]
MKRRPQRWMLLILTSSCIFSSSYCFSSVFLYEHPEELAEKSDAIYIGQVRSMYSSINEDHGISTYVKFKVLQTVKGPEQSEQIAIVHGGETTFQGKHFRQKIHGAAEFHQGETVMVMIKYVKQRPIIQYFGAKLLLRENAQSGGKEWVRQIPSNVEFAQEHGDSEHAGFHIEKSAYMKEEVFDYQQTLHNIQAQEKRP